MSKLEPAQVRGLLAVLDGLSPRSVHHVRAVLNRAVKDGILTRNPAVDVDPPEVHELELHVLDGRAAVRFLEASAGVGRRPSSSIAPQTSPLLARRGHREAGPPEPRRWLRHRHRPEGW